MLQNKCVCVYINIYTFPFIISIKLNGDVDRYLTDIAEAKRNELNTSGFVACVVRDGSSGLQGDSVRVYGGLSAALTSCIREIQRERSVAPLSSAQTQASTMKIGSRGKYFAKFWEIIEKFQTVVTNRVLGLTSRERRLLEKMQREHSSRQQTCVSYIIVRTNIYIEIYHYSS